MTQISIFFIQAVLVVGLPFLMWRSLRWIGLVPLVVVQILTGLALGPSGLGQLFPDFWRLVFDPTQLSPLSGLQWLAVALFAFLTGLHVDAEDFRGYEKTALAAASGSVLVPLGLGAAAGLWLAPLVPDAVGPNGTPAMFALAFALCVAVTALPVMGAILREMEMHDSPLGRLAIGCAACNDAVIWVLLTAMVLAYGHGRPEASPWTDLVLAVGYISGMMGLVRPLVPRWLERVHDEPEMRLAGVVLLIFTSALAADLIGLHFVFGGFLAGLVLPRQFAADIGRQIEPATVIVLLPFFFLMTGLRTEIGLGNSGTLLVFAVGTGVALVGKLAGTAIPCLLTGLPPREAWALGALMQTKGLMEVIVLVILRDAGIIGASAFSGLLLMAVTTTLLTRPLTAVALSLPVVRKL
ncbi:cation:proton antiporter [Magnetospirillum fulvum]|uniref:Kef-type K+ transport system, membrane component KefB n=1 Tax=Magnetospirillum fulvum TaxID=1082 RepID=A0A1H6JR04_MAGFU|nr:cation:proton antiporter [Magnetospirillum fulvum]SEH61641.1 Kef-type K+ transport system, membrane component KefB [Magnetospirillum fulvum]